ncbi:N-acetylmuramoyl-L-alanine amidase [Accumulibacter sp.]|uniref:N-acetylmuramoyl-L-alanine amidase n=1 Tax=Accumulibacter sp. TaxID=2053492 RepID=UPI0025EDD573|nr:N-acetylmuramoyl-L-alanine amidase [Accumulibacter sp.]MCM8614069.1 N-acetylmuramoyl-L-alanine amidase [Accumulibacter sp.]MCM8634460.1 N-acetylmuramoyl-L-alanine amidase [Accumulibacter sp.]MCM8641558.1 N-acetylmuramoyl-L-alanine amidase [Accumulibacter sp.]
MNGRRQPGSRRRQQARARCCPALLPAAVLALATGVLAGCGTAPTGPAAGVVSVPSPNHNARRPNFVIIHDTTNSSAEPALKTLTDPARGVSAHYLVGRDGTLYQLVDEDRRAWHAGASYWGGTTDINSASIGIELDNTGAEPYPEDQIVRLLQLLQELRERHRIPASNVLGHGDVAPGRKVDPGRRFPWHRLAAEGFGLWCRELPPEQDVVALDPLLALQAIGYDVADPQAALAAFRRHFLGVDMMGEASAAERQLLLCLLLDKRRKPAP